MQKITKQPLFGVGQLVGTKRHRLGGETRSDASALGTRQRDRGSELGQLMAIRSTAMAKVYQTLTPDQQQKLQALREARQTDSAGGGEPDRQRRHEPRHTEWSD